MKYAFINGILLDGTENMQPQEGKIVLVEDEKIVDILEYGSIDLQWYKVIDLNGAYLMPGLINLHVHLAADGKPPKENEKPKDYKKLFELLTKNSLIRYVVRKQEAGYAKTALMSGVTTLRAVGGVLDFDGKNRDAINSNEAIGPRILAANTGISVPNGHFAGSLATEAKSVDDVREQVREVSKTNPDLIKLMITGGVMDAQKEGEPGVLRMPAEIVNAACEEAHKLGYMVAAHVESAEGLRVALENGVDTIEHGATPDDEIIRLFKERGSADICTISPALPYAKFELSESHSPKIGKINGAVVLNGIIECAKGCLENNIPVGLGSDVGCPFITHYNFWREVYYFQKYCNVSNSFALYTATLNNAKIVGIDDITGSIEKGKSADMIVVKENPLEDIKALKDVNMVVMRGELFRNPKVKKMKEVDKLLDKYM